MASSTWAVDLILTFSCLCASNTCILDMFPICHSKKSLTKNLFVFYHVYLLTAMKPFRSWFNANTCEIFHLTWLVQSFVRIFQRRSWVTGIFCISILPDLNFQQRSWLNANTCETFHLTWLQSFVRIYSTKSARWETWKIWSEWSKKYQEKSTIVQRYTSRSPYYVSLV